MTGTQAILGLVPFDSASAIGISKTSEATLLGSGTSRGIKVSRIDFAATTAPSLKGLYLCVLDNVLSHSECQRLVSAAETHTDNDWTRVVESSDDGRVVTTRACKRIMWDSPEHMAELWARIRDHVPELHLRQDSIAEWQAKRLNERMRFLKYDAGNYFQAHPDCYYETPNGKERSYITVYIYLNDADVECCGQTFEGGATAFYSTDLSERYTITPKAGRVMLFEQEELLHAGENVASGCKYALRTDLMYKHVEKDE